jgi:hypothetical protein
MQEGEVAFWDRLGETAAVKKDTRHKDTPLLDLAASRRATFLQDYQWSTLVDSYDKLRMIYDPTDKYAQAAMMALGRSMDDEIIEAALGDASTGKQGTGTVSLPNTQKIVPVASSAGQNLNVEALRQAKELFMAADVDPSLQLYMAVSASQLRSLLAETEVTSHDYNTVRALVRGEIDTFMGFKFVHTERLNTRSGSLSFDQSAGTVGSGSGDADGYRRCFAWAQDGILHSVAQAPITDIGPRRDKSMNIQVYAEFSNGAVRMEEAKVVEILCNEA